MYRLQAALTHSFLLFLWYFLLSKREGIIFVCHLVFKIFMLYE